MIMIYLASPIDQGGAAAAALRRQAYGAIERTDAWMYDPATAFRIGNACEEDSRLTTVNQAALIRADGVLSLMPRGVPSVGTPMETEQAIGMGKAVAIVGGYGWHLAADRGRSRRFPEGAVADALEWLLTELRGQERRSGLLTHPLYVAGDGRTPTRSYEGDAGFDLYASEDVKLHVDEFRDVPCDIRVEFPDHCWGLLVGRSSSIRRKGVLVYQGIIDQGYRGELYAGCLNVSQKVAEIKAGERIAQLIPMPLISRQLAPVRVSQLSPSDRGANGFGSSGI